MYEGPFRCTSTTNTTPTVYELEQQLQQQPQGYQSKPSNNWLGSGHKPQGYSRVCLVDSKHRLVA